MKNFFKKIDNFIVNIDFITIISLLMVFITDLGIASILRLYNISVLGIACLSFNFYFNFHFLRILFDSFIKNTRGE